MFVRTLVFPRHFQDKSNRRGFTFQHFVRSVRVKAVERDCKMATWKRAFFSDYRDVANIKIFPVLV